MTLLKSLIGWLIAESLLPKSHAFELPLTKPQGTDAYCYRQTEVAAMIEFCRSRPDLGWMGAAITGLACTGMRISELAGLRWSDVDLRSKTIRIADERSDTGAPRPYTLRQTKGRRGRSVPIHPVLGKVLMSLEKHPDGRVFHGVRGGPLRPNNTLHMFIDQVIESLKKQFPYMLAGEIGFEHGRLHSFRHFFCSQCFLSGASRARSGSGVSRRQNQPSSARENQPT